MPRRSFEDAQKTRQAILSAAIGMTAREGFDHLSLEALAQECRITRGAVYHHFKNKETLFRRMAEFLSREMGDKILAYAKSGPSGGKDPWEALMLGTEGFLRESQSREYQQIILTDAPSALGIEEWQRIDDQFTTVTLVEIFTTLLEGRKKPRAVPLAQCFAGAMNQLSRWISGEEDIREARAILEVMLRGFFSE